ncbi:hypothetical protein [Cystobacter ferrugineus]|uniref:DUF7275 domain-containing protein n=1 Tax=Cystobacter ferrugineus TaxID=83449 RepID=A0A1L9AUL1_9BACT|nr:hypothetical protein [Cystobacter ferrugineus]OJH33676.1 hypothetical protein BON30_47415 [Cystobacter ferrugineus]
MLLIGSRSLSTWLPLLPQLDDWDLLMTEEELEGLRADRYFEYCGESRYRTVVDRERMDVRVTHPDIPNAWRTLFRIAKEERFPLLETPLGPAHNAPPEMHKLLLLATEGLPSRYTSEVRAQCLQEVQPRWMEALEELRELAVSQSIRESFFAGYKKARYVDHDRIHEWIAQGLRLPEGPTPWKLIVNYTEVSQARFQALSPEQKRSNLVEEALALGIERYFIAGVATTSRPLQQLWAEFCNPERPDNAATFRLGELCTPGAIGDHPHWLAEWGREHLPELRAVLTRYLTRMRHSMSDTFWNYARGLRRAEQRRREATAPSLLAEEA